MLSTLKAITRRSKKTRRILIRNTIMRLLRRKKRLSFTILLLLINLRLRPLRKINVFVGEVI